jgi:ubiquinone/menaquinone biosynthesis C-methylase UbiE
VKQDFDHIAINYDQEFTYSVIGQAQRKQVHRFFAQTLRGKNNSDILELNCGTGEDAAWLLDQGHRVHATDISEEMIAVASERLGGYSHATTAVLDIKNISALERKFDMVFSDFGGLNCLSPEDMKKLSVDAYKIIKPESTLVFVVMGRKCWWERLYFILKGSSIKAFRRTSKQSIKSNVDGVLVDTWYYSPKELKKMFQPGFNVVKIKPVGLFIPPSYLNPFFRNKKTLVRCLEFLDCCFSFSFHADYADHYYIEMRKI